MIFYKVVNNKLVFPRVALHQLEVGETYNLNSYIEKGSFKGQKQTYFFEHAIPYKTCAVMTNPEGKKAFAVATNDSVRDNFPQFCLAKILVSEGNHIVMGFSDSISSETINIIIMQVVDVNPEVSFLDEGQSINVKILDMFTYIEKNVSFDPKFTDAVLHTVMIVRRNVGDYATLKYSFNPGRIITTRLFIRDESDDVVSYLEDGRKLILNRNSSEIYKQVGKPGSLVTTAILRCFYSKKHKDKHNIIVDGCRLQPVWENELPIYIQKSSLTTEMASSLIKKVLLPHGNYIYAVVNIKGEIRPIFHSSKGFWTFALNEYEQSFIRGIQDMTF